MTGKVIVARVGMVKFAKPARRSLTGPWPQKASGGR